MKGNTRKDDVRKIVREGYGEIVRQGGGCGCSPSAGCCGSGAGGRAATVSQQIGYSAGEVESVPDGANLGLGCGNPVALASLKAGEVVLDLGSGGGFDCFLAAQRVGNKGRVIGVDMTADMLDRARANASKGGNDNVEFRLGEIENLPVADNHVDVIISNCVINLSPDKQRVFREAYRVLKPGGRLMVSDIVLLKPLPEALMSSIAAYVGCLAGAMIKEDYLGAIKAAGFRDVSVAEETRFPVEMMANDPTAQVIMKKIPGKALSDAVESVLSVRVRAVKPA